MVCYSLVHVSREASADAHACDREAYSGKYQGKSNSYERSRARALDVLITIGLSSIQRSIVWIVVYTQFSCLTTTRKCLRVVNIIIMLSPQPRIKHGDHKYIDSAPIGHKLCLHVAHSRSGGEDD